LLLVPLAVAGAACSSAGPTFDRDAAIARVMRDSGGLVDHDQAACYVDRVSERLGTGPLEEGAPPVPPEQVPVLTGIRIDCVGLANLGTTPPGTTPRVTEDEAGIPLPQKPGDDPQLDQLYRACGAGDDGACDQLFDRSALGSVYEQFAASCGGRGPRPRCAASTASGSVPAG
jgi:hypothetical protein